MAQPGMVFTLMLYSDHDIWGIEYSTFRLNLPSELRQFKSLMRKL